MLRAGLIGKAPKRRARSNGCAGEAARTWRQGQDPLHGGGSERDLDGEGGSDGAKRGLNRFELAKVAGGHKGENVGGRPAAAQAHQTAQTPASRARMYSMSANSNEERVQRRCHLPALE